MVFPFVLPAPTAFYLTLFVLTFALHQAFMHYVLAGSLYVAWATICPGKSSKPRADQPLGSTLRDWMPFMLSCAITAGVAPLLFVQILYPRRFYTANLLLAWRWMIVIPVLIVAFYLLYLLKSAAFSQWPYVARVTIALTVAACLVFVGFCWTANHVLAGDESAWPSIYASGTIPLSAALVIPRMLVWTGAALAGMAVIAGWQLRGAHPAGQGAHAGIEPRRLAVMALAGITIAAIAMVVFLFQVQVPVRRQVLGTATALYVAFSIVGVLLQAVSWALQLRRGAMTGGLLAIASIGWVLMLVAVSALRESMRLASVDVAALLEQHAQAGAIGGVTVFVIFAVVNAAVIIGCIQLVRRELARPT